MGVGFNVLGQASFRMPSYDLTQSEADALIALEKRRADDNRWRYAGMGGGVSIPLASTDGPNVASGSPAAEHDDRYRLEERN